MNKVRDRYVALAANVVLFALAAAVVALVLEAQRRGIDTREELRLEQIESEAGSMESLLQTSFAGLAARDGAPGTWNMTPGDPADSARLQPTNPDARTGRVLVDVDGVIVNGSLLRDQSLIGTKVERDGLDRVLAGELSMLPMANGLTTTFPTIATGVPVRDAGGNLSGAVLNETEVAPDSVFNLFVAEFPARDTIEISYVDENGIVVASSNDSALAKPIAAEVAKDLVPGFHRGDGKVAAIATVPSARWTLVFTQDIGEFEGDLTGPLQGALLLFLGAVGIAGVVAVVALLRRLAAAREEQRRLREISDAREEFTSIVSHELRTPVAGLLGFLQTTIDHWDAMSESERRRSVQRAFTNARALQTLTSDVLDSASIEGQTLSYRFEAIDLRTCAADAIEALRDIAPNRTITFNKPDQPLLVRGDAVRLGQVLANLLDNAAKSSAPDSPIDVDLTRNGSSVTVSVRDRGPGIAPDERERIFEKFTRGRTGAGRGTGLGLYISRHIVEAHGGTIDAESMPGEPGARLRFSLPAL